MKRMIDTLYPSMPWDAIDAVVFDIGNVLVEMDEHQVLRAMFPDDEALRQSVLRHTLRSPYWHMLDGGELSMDECVEAMTEGDPSLPLASRALPAANCIRSECRTSTARPYGLNGTLPPRAGGHWPNLRWINNE